MWITLSNDLLAQFHRKARWDAGVPAQAFVKEWSIARSSTRIWIFSIICRRGFALSWRTICTDRSDMFHALGRLARFWPKWKSLDQQNGRDVSRIEVGFVGFQDNHVCFLNFVQDPRCQDPLVQQNGQQQIRVRISSVTSNVNGYSTSVTIHFFQN